MSQMPSNDQIIDEIKRAALDVVEKYCTRETEQIADRMLITAAGSVLDGYADGGTMRGTLWSMIVTAQAGLYLPCDEDGPDGEEWADDVKAYANALARQYWGE